MWECKDTVTEIKNVFEGFICRLITAKERISELEDISLETSQTESKEKNEWKLKGTEYPRIVEQLQKNLTCIMWISEDKWVKKEQKKYLK